MVPILIQKYFGPVELIALNFKNFNWHSNTKIIPKILPNLGL